jgi:hypothetical protein
VLDADRSPADPRSAELKIVRAAPHLRPGFSALGATEQLSEAERRLYGEGYLRDLLTVRFGGRSMRLT